MSKRSLNLNRAVSCHTANQGLVGWWLGLPGCLDKTSLRDITPFRNPAILDPPNSGYKSSVVLDGTNTRFYSLLNTAGTYNYAGATARILNILPLSLKGPLSVSAWFRNTAATSGYTGQFLSLCNSSNNWGLGLGYNQIVTTRYGAILNTSPCGASPGTYHYLYTQDGANHNKLFINGVLYASATGAGDAANLDTIQIIKGVGNVGSSVGDYVGDVRVLNWDASNQAGFLYRQRLKAYPDLLAYRSWVSFAKPAGAAANVSITQGAVALTPENLTVTRSVGATISQASLSLTPQAVTTSLAALASISQGSVALTAQSLPSVSMAAGASITQGSVTLTGELITFSITSPPPPPGVITATIAQGSVSIAGQQITTAATFGASVAQGSVGLTARSLPSVALSANASITQGSVNLTAESLPSVSLAANASIAQGSVSLTPQTITYSIVPASPPPPPGTITAAIVQGSVDLSGQQITVQISSATISVPFDIVASENIWVANVVDGAAAITMRVYSETVHIS